MHDVRADLDDLWRASGALSREMGGRALMFMAATSGEGTSSIAASFSLMTAARARRSTWLVDLGFHENKQIKTFNAGFAADTGRPGRAYDASLGVLPFFNILAEKGALTSPTLRDGKFLAAHQISGTRLLVTRFRHERMDFGQRVSMSARDDWWKVLRRSADWIIVDAPALDVSHDGLKLVSHMDGVVIVVRSDATSLQQVRMLKSEIEQAGGHVLGVVMNQVSGDSLIADRLAS